MRVLHVISSLDPAEGGPPMIAAQLAAGQGSLGHEVVLAALDQPTRQIDIDQALAEVPFLDRVTVHRLPASGGLWDRLTAAAARDDLERLVGGADIVHLHSVWHPVLLTAGRICRRQGKPYIILVNGILDPWCLRQKRLKKKLALALAFRKHLDGAAALHLGNGDEQRLIEPLGLTVPGVIIPNGVFFEGIEPLPEPQTFYGARPELNGHPYVLFLSRIHHKKGPDFLADAFAQMASDHPDVHLVVAGPDGGARAGFEAKIKAHGLTDRVHLVGPLYGPDKYAALVDALCFCLPSWQEGFSIAITEALACGVPVVISEGCHFPEVAEAGAGEVVPLSADSVADALGRVLSDEQLRLEMGRNARSLIESRYTWGKIAERTVEVYGKLLVG